MGEISSILGSSEQTAPAAPWTLTGSSIVMLTKARPEKGVLLAFVHYDSSPVGPYDELARMGLTLRGPSVLEMLVTSEETRQGGRQNWGFPKELADLHWQQDGNRITFRAGADKWRFRACGPSMPIRLSGWTVQELEGSSVKVPVKIRGRLRLAFNGRRWAVLLSGFEMLVLPAA